MFGGGNKVKRLFSMLLVFSFLLIGCQEKTIVTEGYVMMVEEGKVYLAKNATFESFNGHKDLDVRVINEKGKAWLIVYDYEGNNDTIQKGDKVKVFSDKKPTWDGTWLKGKAEKIELVARLMDNLNKCSSVLEENQQPIQSSTILKCVDLGLD